MRVADCDVVIVPGLGNSSPDHWQSRWEAKLPNARRVTLRDWDGSDRTERVDSLRQTVDACTKPVVLVAHSLGVHTVAHAAQHLPIERIKGAFLVAPSDLVSRSFPLPIDQSFKPIPRVRLPFPALIAASSNDPYGSFAFAEELALAWGATLVGAGDSGHINTESGHGPWPEGLMRFAGFLKSF